MYGVGSHLCPHTCPVPPAHPHARTQAVTAQFGVPGLKAALEKVGYYGGPVRGPLLPLPKADEATLYTILAEAQLL